MSSGETVIIGAGPAGLAAAHELTTQGVRPLVLDKGDKVGGISRTEVYKDYRFDIGGHRFYTRFDEVRALWHEMLDAELLTVPRLSRIHYRGKFFKYPLTLSNTLGNLGVFQSVAILLSYLKAKLAPHRRVRTFEQWVTNRFGARLYRTFFQTYTEKVWGMPCNEIRADWAAQRIGSLSIGSALRNALFGAGPAKTLIDEFEYPTLGPGMMWERFGEVVAQRGGGVRQGAEAVEVRHEDGRARRVVVRIGGQDEEIDVEQVISSMPLSQLITRLHPAPPMEVLEAAAGLRYRSFILVGLVLDREDLFPDHWLYVHSPAVRVGRIQNFKNWSPAMVPHPAQTCLGMEYFCNEGGELWLTSDDKLRDLAGRELEHLKLAPASAVVDGHVIRQSMAYPIYDHWYRRNLRRIRGYLATFRNLQTVGRNGMHRYNNQDHSMLTGMLAGRNIAGAEHNLWSVNDDER